MRRLEVARRGAEVLDEKRRTLLREQQHLSASLAEATAEWNERAGDAARWNDRAATLAGPRRLRIARLHHGGGTGITVEWRNALGAVFPTEATVRFGESPDFVALGGGASVALAAKAHTEALLAAAAYAVASAAHEAVTAELVATTRRLRAIEERWIPEHEAALRRLALELEQRELEDTLRVRWVIEQRQGSPNVPPR